MSSIYILLPVHNRKEITRGFIECLKVQTFSDYQLLLIDDGSTDDSADMVMENIPSAIVIKGTGDWWWAGSLQHGIDWLHRQQIQPDDIVLMINDDVSIDSNFLDAGRKELELLPNTLLQAIICCNHSRKVLDAGVVYNDKKMQFSPAQPGDTINCLTTNGLFMRWSDLVLIGKFHPKLLPHYLSDYEFTIRAGRKGLQLRVAQDLKLWWNQQTTGFRNFDESNFILFWTNYFSKRSAVNPIYLTGFVLLTSKLSYIPLHLLRIWKNALIAITRHAFSALKAKFSGTANKG